MLTTYEPTLTMREARARYFEVNGFGPNGGYDEDWVDYKLGPLPMPVPNTAGRKRAVAYHDLHHVVTGYDTNTIGEFEISAWEIGAGCKDVVAAWAINLGGLAAGVLAAPRKTFRAFVRGRRMHTLYGRPLEPLLDRTVEDVRALVVHGADEAPRVADVALFALAALAGGVVGGTLAALALPLVPVGLYRLRRRPVAA